MPAAKLLDGKEQAPANGSPLIYGSEVGRAHIGLLFAVFAVFCALTLNLPASLLFLRRRCAIEHSLRWRFDVALASRFFRPPPVLV